MPATSPRPEATADATDETLEAIVAALETARDILETLQTGETAETESDAIHALQETRILAAALERATSRAYAKARSRQTKHEIKTEK